MYDNNVAWYYSFVEAFLYWNDAQIYMASVYGYCYTDGSMIFLIKTGHQHHRSPKTQKGGPGHWRRGQRRIQVSEIPGEQGQQM